MLPRACCCHAIYRVEAVGLKLLNCIFLNDRFQKIRFLSKKHNFVHLGPYVLVQISLAYSPSTYQLMYGETLNFKCQHLQRLSSYGKFNAKIDIPIGHFMLPSLTLTSLESLHTLFNRYWNHILVKCEQKFMVLKIQNFQLFGKEWFTAFEKVSAQFWKTFL